MDLLKIVRLYWSIIKLFIGGFIFLFGFILWILYPNHNIISSLGLFLAAVASVQLIYEILFRDFEKKIFKEELKKLWDEEIPSIIKKSPIFFENGRRDPKEKIEFYQKAQYEIIEIAATLHALQLYYKSLSDQLYSEQIKKILNKGVNIKLFLVNPESNFAKVYNESTNDEEDIINKIQESISFFKNTIPKFNIESKAGKIELYKYDDIPYYNGVFLDINQEDFELGEIFISHYLHKLPRKDNPGFSFTKCKNPKLFEKYKESINKLIEKSELII